MIKTNIESQCMDVLNHLRQYKEISPMEAFEKFSITRLAAVIYDLRESGYNIKTVMVETKTRYNRTCRYALYVLEEDE